MEENIPVPLPAGSPASTALSKVGVTSVDGEDALSLEPDL
jgi:hypothetical protein